MFTEPTLSYEVVDLDEHTRVTPITTIRLDNEMIVVEVEDGSWRLAKRWRAVDTRFFSLVRREFSREFRGTRDQVQTWVRQELDRMAASRAAREPERTRVRVVA